MAFRTQIRIGALLIGALDFAAAQGFLFNVRHGTVRVTETTISFEDAKRTLEWQFGDVQQLSLSQSQLRLLTYEDQRWKLGRDREFVFDRLPPGIADQLYGFLRPKLDQRFIVELADGALQPLWQVEVKLQRGRGGSRGTLLIGQDRIVYRSQAAGDSRTWRYEDIEIVSSPNPFELTFLTPERSGWDHGSPTEFRFQLKTALPESRYNELWKRLNRTRGLAFLSEM